MRVRGLKHDQPGGRHAAVRVAPHAGAWIETTNGGTEAMTDGVAPHAGAWIETGFSGQYGNGGVAEVAPHAGAWIETWVRI